MKCGSSAARCSKVSGSRTRCSRCRWRDRNRFAGPMPLSSGLGRPGSRASRRAGPARPRLTGDGDACVVTFSAVVSVTSPVATPRKR